MIQDNTVTIRLPPSQMALLRFTAFHRDVTVERLVVEQLDLDGLEGIYAALVQDTGQGKMARADIRKCQRCKHLRLLGGGATLCFECEHEFADQCPDVLHEALAVLEQGDDSSDDGFNCPNCNMWLKESDATASAKRRKAMDDALNKIERMFEVDSKRYTVPFSNEQFRTLRVLVDLIFRQAGTETARRVMRSVDNDTRSLRSMLGSDLRELASGLKAQIKTFENSERPRSAAACDSLDSFILNGFLAVETIERALEARIQRQLTA